MIRGKRGKARWRGLGDHLRTKRIVVCVGAGGVGKTTIAAAMAVRAAREGRRVACITIDPARRLADSLEVSGAAKDGGLTDITAAIAGRTEGEGRLAFGMLDPAGTFDRFVRERASSPEKARQILSNTLYRYISGSLSGMHEYMALEKLSELAGDPEHDLIILDTPPTANAIDFFTAPRRMKEALDGSLVRMMRRAYGGPGRIGFDLLGRWAGILLKAVSKITGAQLLGEIMGFVDALSDLFGSFSERADTVERVLHGEEVSFCLVTTPDKATFKEARDLHRRLGEIGIPVNAVVFNRAHWPRADSPPSEIEGEAAVYLRRRNAAWNQAHIREAEFVKRVREGWAGLETVGAVPILPGGASGMEGLGTVGSYL